MWRIVSFALVVALCVFWVIFLRPQSLGGPAAYVLVSGKSMLPRYHTGDLVLVEHRSSYRVGDVIAYRVPKGQVAAGAQVIHRIVGGDAVHGWIMQGDNRTAPDVWRPKPGDVVGAKALRIPNGVVALQMLGSPLFLGLLVASFAFVFLFSRGHGETQEAEPAQPGGDAKPAGPVLAAAPAKPALAAEPVRAPEPAEPVRAAVPAQPDRDAVHAGIAQGETRAATRVSQTEPEDAVGAQPVRTANDAAVPQVVRSPLFLVLASSFALAFLFSRVRAAKNTARPGSPRRG